MNKVENISIVGKRSIWSLSRKMWISRQLVVKVRTGCSSTQIILRLCRTASRYLDANSPQKPVYISLRFEVDLVSSLRQKVSDVIYAMR